MKTEQPLYFFHPLAEQQQVDIWLYTYQQWGEKQADKYIDDMHSTLANITNNPSLIRKLPLKIDNNIGFFHYQRHYIFLKKMNDKIQVLSILHDNMDIPARLHEILSSL